MGELLRTRPPDHDECHPPNVHDYGRGTVWRCDCGRRWVRVINYNRAPITGAAWARRILPWPRARRAENPSPMPSGPVRSGDCAGPQSPLTADD